LRNIFLKKKNKENKSVKRSMSKLFVTLVALVLCSAAIASEISVLRRHENFENMLSNTVVALHRAVVGHEDASEREALKCLK
jgi:hypothetical protein